MFACKVGKIAVLSLGLAAVSAVFAEPALTMRIDDNHSVKDWTRVADIFEKRGIKVSFAVVPAELSESQGKCLKELSDRGHELMDHMPNHAFYRAKYHDRAAFENYWGQTPQNHCNLPPQAASGGGACLSRAISR